jgi:hypothetical protein
MRRMTHVTSQTTHAVRNIGGAGDEQESKGSAVPAGAVLDEPLPLTDDSYRPPDGAAEVPETIPRGGAPIRD